MPKRNITILCSVTFVLCVWLPLLGRDLWIDEAVSYWLIKDSFGVLVERILNFGGQGPLYYSIIWAWRHLVGISEFALRFPSFLFALLACSGVFFLGKRWFDRETAYRAVLIFVCLEQTVFGATNIRSYSFGVAMAVLSLCALTLWSERRLLRYVFFYAVATALCVHAHYFFGTIVVVHVLYLITLDWCGVRKYFRHLLIASLLTAAMIAPALPHLRVLAAKQSLMEFLEQPTFSDFMMIWLPWSIIGLVAASVLIAWVRYKFGFWFNSLASRRKILFLLCWASAPSLLLWCCSAWTGTAILTERYAAPSTAGFALLVAVVIGSIENEKGRTAVCVLFTFFMLVVSTVTFRQEEQWQDAIRFARNAHQNEQHPVLAYTGLTESRNISWLSDASKKSYLLTPFDYYQLGTTPLLAPVECTSTAAKRYYDSELGNVLPYHHRLVLIYRKTRVGTQQGQEEYSGESISRCLAGYGFVVSEQLLLSRVGVTVYDKQ